MIAECNLSPRRMRVHVEAPAEPSDSVQMAYCKLVTERNDRLTKAMIAAQMYCSMGDCHAAGAELSQALTGL